MKNLIKRAHFALYILLAVVLYLVLIPATIIQACVYAMHYQVYGEYLFDTNKPFSGEAARRIMQYYR